MTSLRAKVLGASAVWGCCLPKLVVEKSDLLFYQWSLEVELSLTPKQGSELVLSEMLLLWNKVEEVTRSDCLFQVGVKADLLLAWPAVPNYLLSMAFRFVWNHACTKYKMLSNAKLYWLDF